MFTYEFLEWKVYVGLHQGKASTMIRGTVSSSWEVWVSRLSSGATFKFGRRAQCIPRLLTQEVLPPTNVVLEDIILLEPDLTYKAYPIKIL
jgi:hypothetical protein